MSEAPAIPPRDVYEPDRLANSLEAAAEQIRRAGPPQAQRLDQILLAVEDTQRQMQEMRREMRTGFARIDYRLHNIEARAKNEDAFERRADYVPLLKADGTAIANFPLNAEAVDNLNTQAINALLTDLGVNFQGRTLAKKKVLFLCEIGVKTTHNG